MVESDIKEYFESIGTELESIKNRVRNLIGSTNWGDEGRYKEAILKNTLRRFLPQDISVATGFVAYKENNKIESTKQIDLILYDNTYPILFKEGDFVILDPEPVMGIIEVKTNIHDRPTFEDILKASYEKSKNIMDSKQLRGVRPHFHFFNGIYSYSSGIGPENCLNLYREHIVSLDYDLKNIVGYICLGPDTFMIARSGKFEAYKLERLATSYFISNLLECFKYPQMTEPLLWYAYPDKSDFMIGSVSLRRE